MICIASCTAKSAMIMARSICRSLVSIRDLLGPVHPRTQEKSDAYLLYPEMPVLGETARVPLGQNPPESNGAEDNAKYRHRSNPDVDKALREVISKRAQRTPALLVPA